MDDNVVEIRGLMKRIITLLADKDAALSDAEHELTAANKAIVALDDYLRMLIKEEVLDQCPSVKVILALHAPAIEKARGG